MGRTKEITVSVLLFFGIISIIVCCDPSYFKDGRHSWLILKNNSEIDICVYGTTNYPDTTINRSYPTWYHFPIVEAGKSGDVVPAPLGDWWEKTFNIKNLQYISIFIFDKAFLEPNIGNGNFTVNETMALQRYDLTLENLNSLKWTIPYPPDERMKYMKMYPPYGK